MKIFLRKRTSLESQVRWRLCLGPFIIETRQAPQQWLISHARTKIMKRSFYEPDEFRLISGKGYYFAELFEFNSKVHLIDLNLIPGLFSIQ